MSISWESSSNGSNTETQEFSSNPAINRKVKLAAAGLQRNIQKRFLAFPTEQDKELAADFLIACMHQENIAIKTKRVYLVNLSRFLKKGFNYKKSFKEITAQDLTDYLGNMHKDRSIDPDQSWVGTRNQHAMVISKFYKWVAFPDKTPEERRNKIPKDQLPPVLKGVTLFVSKKGPKCPIKARDKWDDQDFATALKHLEGNPRLSCYIAAARDMSARPEEILQLRLRDIDHAIKIASDGSEYASVEVGRHSKKKMPRSVPMVQSVKHYRVWRHQHPAANKPESFAFISKERSAQYQNVPISVESLRAELKKLKEQYFPTLLRRPDISQEDKQKIEKLLSRKFTPYALRHSSIQRYARSGISDYDLRLHAGWSKTSDMIEVYTTEEGGESCEDILRLAFNIDTRNKKQQQDLEQEFKGKKCPACGVENLAHAQTCIECNRTLDPIKLGIMIEEAENTKKELADIRVLFARIEANESELKRKSDELAALQTHIMKRLAWQEEQDKIERERGSKRGHNDSSGSKATTATVT
jgi:integrase